jgi:uncharacterized protein (UPF0548 family)
MSIRLRRPTQSELEGLLASCAGESLTYSPVGSSLDGVTPNGLRRRRWSVALPAECFDRASESIAAWEVHRGADLSVLADGPVEAGTNVAMSAPLPVGFVDVTCRVVAVVEEPDRRGFAYGTLPIHPESGEEAFVIVRDDSGVRFEVEAVSKPRHPLARLVPPVADRLQDQAVQRYLTAMTRLVNE